VNFVAISAEQWQRPLARQCIHAVLNAVLHLPVLLFEVLVVVGAIGIVIVIEFDGLHQPGPDLGGQRASGRPQRLPRRRTVGNRFNSGNLADTPSSPSK
jgi:hypothetical protein